MNELILFISIGVAFGSVLLSNKLFGKNGLIAWVAMASIFANILTAKNAQAFGVSFTIGTAYFASTFLATDVLTELYGAKAAKKAVYVGAFATVSLIIAEQIGLWFIPTAFDTADGPMRSLFTLSLRVSIASVAMYFIANLADVWLYEKIREKTNGKAMWLRNNVSTILCNCLENFLFMFGAFYGIFEVKNILQMAIATSIIEIIAGLCDTPFLYIAKATGQKKLISDCDE